MKRKAWHRKEDETPKAYSAFKIFLELSPKDRSVSEAWRRYAKKTKKDGNYNHFFDRWFRKHEWKERVTAYEEYVLNQNLNNILKEQKEIAINFYGTIKKYAKRMLENADIVEEREIASNLRAIVSALKDLGIVVQQPETPDDTESKGLHIVLDVSEIEE